MTEFEKVKELTHNYGTNGYLEVARKRLTEGDRTTEFLFVSRGFYERGGEKRWTKFVTLPDDPALKEWLAKALQEV